MKTLSKFILNRNDKVFYYVEKVQHRQGTIHYIVYLNEKLKHTYNQENFYAIYGTDSKISIHKFSTDAMNILIHGAIENQRQEKSYNDLVEISRKTMNFDKLNPKIESKSLIEALEIYNTLLPKSIEENMDYEEEYLYVNGITKEKTEREHYKSIETLKVNSNEEKIEYNDERGMTRIKKYD